MCNCGSHSVSAPYPGVPPNAAKKFRPKGVAIRKPRAEANSQFLNGTIDRNDVNQWVRARDTPAPRLSAKMRPPWPMNKPTL